ncbi:hypothetical protein I4U23_004176 [Adineta vaga]|nr:hypothetical protein I4U23_004176 [Adineta vaga]
MHARLAILVFVSIIGCHQIVGSLFGEEILHALQPSLPTSRGIFDKTCSKLYNLLAFPRRVLGLTVLENTPVRVRVEMEMTDPATNAKDNFFVEGLVCQNGFNQYVCDAICRSQNKRCVAVVPNLPFRPDPVNSRDKCFFQYGQDQLEIQCTYILDKFSCPFNAINLGKCNHTTLFEHQCAGDMHVGVMCV